MTDISGETHREAWHPERSRRKSASHPNTGLPWLVQLPVHWETRRLKFIATVTMGQSPDSKGCNERGIGAPFLQGNAEFGGPHVGARHPRPKQFCPTPPRLCRPGDLLLSVRAPVGALNIADRVYGIGRGLCAIRLRAELDSAFAWYAFQLTRHQLYAVATGSTYDAVSVDEVGGMICPIPPLREQRAIATFLDRKTIILDALTCRYTRLLDGVEERRAFLVRRAVTKGLDPDVALRDSGLPWLGQLPAHWPMRRLKFLAEVTMGQSPDSKTCNARGEGPPFLQGNAEFGEGHPCAGRYPTPKQFCPTAKKICAPGDLLLSVRAPVGALNIADRAYGIGRGLCAITLKPNGALEGAFAWYLLHLTRHELQSVATGSTYDAVSLDEVENMRCPLPPRAEQRAIVAVLDRETARLDALAAKIRVIIDRLAEYRAALITAAVTGKVVRD
jgi:type I restriction enzyme S subunit